MNYLNDTDLNAIVPDPALAMQVWEWIDARDAKRDLAVRADALLAAFDIVHAERHWQMACELRHASAPWRSPMTSSVHRLSVLEDKLLATAGNLVGVHLRADVV